MKKTVIAIVLATFGGVFGALQLDHALQRREAQGSYSVSGDASNLFKAEFDVPGVAPAPFDFRQAAKRASQSVVSVDRYEDRPTDFFGQNVVRSQTGTGSGVILSQDGIIVTNNHVVEGAKGLKVRFADSRTFDANLLGRDPRSDLAVLKIPTTGLTPIEVGTSKDLDVGEWVIAVGNPLGFDNTVSVGVVSSTKRSLPLGDQGLVDGIQTDAAINPGNSGGALCDSSGRLIGINSAIASSTGMSIGIGFAIPVDRMKAVVGDIVKLGYARYAGLGISHRPDFDGALADPDFRAQVAQQAGSATDVPRKGVLVMDVAAGGAAARAGLHKYDIIVALDDKPIQGSFDLNKALVPKKPGESVSVKFWSRGAIQTKTLVLQEVESRD